MYDNTVNYACCLMCCVVRIGIGIRRFQLQPDRVPAARHSDRESRLERCQKGDHIREDSRGGHQFDGRLRRVPSASRLARCYHERNEVRKRTENKWNGKSTQSREYRNLRICICNFFFLFYQLYFFIVTWSFNLTLLQYSLKLRINEFQFLYKHITIIFFVSICSRRFSIS